MNIQKVQNQPQFTARMPVAGKAKELAEVFAKVCIENPEAKQIVTGKGRLAYIVTKADVSRLEGKSGEIAKDVFESIAGTAAPLKAKDVLKAIKEKRFDFDLLNMPR